GDAAERRALVPPPAGLDVRVEQPPRVDRDGLLDHRAPRHATLPRRTPPPPAPPASPPRGNRAGASGNSPAARPRNEGSPAQTPARSRASLACRRHRSDTGDGGAEGRIAIR